MRFLLTSAGIKNPSVHDALVDLWAKCQGVNSFQCSAAPYEPSG